VWRARAILAGLLLFGVTTALRTIPDPGARETSPPLVYDRAMIEELIGRIRAGESYYPTLSDELHARYYPAGSVSAWRTPILWVASASVPPRMRGAAFVLLAAAVLTLAVWQLRALGSGALLLGVAAEIGALAAMWSWQALTETWCGLLLALSVLSYMQSRWLAGAGFGIAALFIRELAAPYCCACIALALLARRRSEAFVWAGGIAAYACFFAAHVTRVSAYQQAGDPTALPLFAFGGLHFIIETIARTNTLFAVGPHFAVGLAVVLLVSAWWAPRAPAHLLAAIAAYGLFFTTFGYVFNDYWGFVTAPTSGLAFAYGVVGLLWLRDEATSPK